jgi:hypothetical protein
MDTFFAPAERVNENELITEIKIVSQNPVISVNYHKFACGQKTVRCVNMA